MLCGGLPDGPPRVLMRFCQRRCVGRQPRYASNVRLLHLDHGLRPLRDMAPLPRPHAIACQAPRTYPWELNPGPFGQTQGAQRD